MKANKIISLLLAVVMLVGALPITAMAADWGEGDTLEEALSEFKVGSGDTLMDWLVLPGLGVIYQRYNYFLFQNDRTGSIDEHPVYCIDPTKGGAYEIVKNVGPNDDGSATATYIRGEKVGDVKYRGILGAGFPHNMVESLGLQTREEGYYATKLALWMYIRGNDPTKLSINPKYASDDPVATRVRDAAVAIYTNGTSYGGGGREPGLTITGKPSNTAKLDAAGEYYVQGIEITASGWVGTDRNGTGPIQLEWDSAPPSGTIVLGSNGEDITDTLLVTTSYGANGPAGKATIKYPASEIDVETFAPPTIKATAIVPNDDIYIAYAKAGKTTYQRYLVERDPKIPVTASFVSQITIPWDEDFPDDSGLRIRKVQTGTKEPLAGAIFDIRDPEGKLIYSLATDDSGIIDIPLYEAGNYTVTETTAPRYHLLPQVRTQSVYVRYGEVAEVTFENAPYGTLRIVKRDAANGQSLGGVAVKIKHITTNATHEGITDSSGCVVFDKLPVGGYEIVEVTAPDGYQLDSTVHTVNVTPLSEGESSYVLTNKANAGLRIIKFDRQTSTPIEGVSFEIWKDGELYTTQMTDAWGEIELRNLPSGTYTAREVATVEPYVLDPTAQWIEIEAGQGYISELYFFNLVKPGMSLVKIDSETYEPLPGAKFKISQVGGSFSSEYTTNKNGEIDLSALEPGAYTVQEIYAPAGYLIDDAIRTIQLNSGETAQFVFSNTKKPTLIVLKIDAETTKPLPGAEFSIKHKDGGVIWEGLTDENGEIRLYDLDPDWYTITEILPPPGYIADTAPKDVKFEPGETIQVKFDNTRKPVVVFQKTNGLTGKGIAGATFKIEYEQSGGGLLNLGSYKTDSNGQIIIPRAEVGWYVFTETRPANGFSLPSNPVTRLYVSAGQNAYLSEFDGHYGVQDSNGGESSNPMPTLSIEEHSGIEYYVQGEGFNWPLNSVVIKKTHAITGELLAGAVFELYRADEQVSGVPGTSIGRYTTDHSGVVVITGLEPGYYIVKEVQAPQNFLLSENSQQHGYLKTDGTTVLEFSFANYPYGSLLIVKTDAKTHQPLSGTRFKVTDSEGAVVGSSGGEFTTDEHGEVLIPNLKPGAYVVTELEAPVGYALTAQPRTIDIGTDGKTYKAEFANEPLGSLVIRKLDKATKQPLEGAEFMITAADGSVVGTSGGIFVTDQNGIIEVPNLPRGSYVIKETRAPEGYVLENKTQTIAISYGLTYTVTVENAKMSGVQIIKIDASTKEPLKDAKFTIYKKSGDVVGTYTTNGDGIIIVDGLAPGWYKAVETKAPDGYLIDDIPQDFEVTSNQFIKLTFENKALSSLQIRKQSEADGSALAGAVFEVRKQNGEYVGEYTTGKDGSVSIPNADPGWYVVSEIKAPTGYILDNTAKTAEVKPVTPTVVTFTNKPLAGLQIKKIDADTRQAIAGVSFSVSKQNGERIGEYTTGSDGLVYISELEPGWYSVVETKAADGYLLDSEPKSIEVKWGDAATLTVENTAMSGLLIVKTDAKTGKPLAGVVFDVSRADGQRVTGNIADGNQPGTEANSPNKTTSPNGDISGSYTTDANGRIRINSLPAGEYHIIERKALDGYELDTTVHSVTVTPGKLATLQVTNTQKAGFRLLKIDSVTKKPIYGVEFMVFDANNKVVGTYITDNNGIIDFDGILSEGRYTIRETRAAAGYYRDDMPRTVEFKSGKVTEVVWENTPEMGQIQITKLSGDDNEVNGLPKGTPLAGAIFEVYDYKSGNLLDRFVSGTDGRAVSKPLPIGRYIVKEVQAPQWYRLSSEALDIDIEFATQIIKRDFLNYSANTGVNIRKTGNYEAMPGNSIRYDIKAVGNTSSVPLTDFYWRDTLPTDAVRLTKIVTGTYNQSLKYKVMITTNKGDTRIIADNLSTTVNNVIDCRNAALGLASDEYVTSFTLVFGTVKAGFCQVEQPQIYMTVTNGLPNGYQFANKVDVGGKYGSEWVIGNSTWVTTIYAQPTKMPRTGY